MFRFYVTQIRRTSLTHTARKSPESQRSNVNSILTKTRTPTLEHRYPARIPITRQTRILSKVNFPVGVLRRKSSLPRCFPWRIWYFTWRICISNWLQHFRQSRSMRSRTNPIILFVVFSIRSFIVPFRPRTIILHFSFNTKLRSSR